MTVAKKTVEIRNKKTGKLAGSVSLAGKKAPKSATKPVAKKAIVKKASAPKKATAPVAVKTPGTGRVLFPKIAKTTPAPVKDKLPEDGLSFASILSLTKKLDETQMSKLVASQTSPDLMRSYSRSVEVASNALLDDEGDDTELIRYEETWLNAHPALFGESSSYDTALLDPDALIVDQVYEIAARTHLALLARKSLDLDESNDYEVLTYAWRKHIGQIHPDDEDILLG